VQCDQLIDGHLSMQLDHTGESVHGLLSANSSAPPALLRPDEGDADDGVSDGQSSRCSMSSAADPSTSDVVDADEWTSQCSASAPVCDLQRVSMSVKDGGPPQRPKVDRRRKSSLSHAAWNRCHEAELARKVGIV